MRLVIFQDGPGTWVVRGLEHDIAAEGTTIGAAVRAAVRFIEAHAAFDERHGYEPLSTFAGAAQPYWNAFATGTPVPLNQLGVAPPREWDIQAAFASRPPCPTFGIPRPAAAPGRRWTTR